MSMVGDLENKLDDALKALQTATDRVAELQEERDALVAHNGKLESIMKELKEDELQCGCGNIHCDWYFDHDVITLALAQSPQLSLAERDARVARDAIRAFYMNADSVRSPSDVDDFIKQYATTTARSTSQC